MDDNWKLWGLLIFAAAPVIVFLVAMPIRWAWRRLRRKEVQQAKPWMNIDGIGVWKNLYLPHNKAYYLPGSNIVTVGPDFGKPTPYKPIQGKGEAPEPPWADLEKRIEALEQGRAIEPNRMVPPGYDLHEQQVEWQGPEYNAPYHRTVIRIITHSLWFKKGGPDA